MFSTERSKDIKKFYQCMFYCPTLKPISWIVFLISRHTSLKENKHEMPFWICIWVCITPRLQRNWRVHPLFLFLKVPIIRSKLFTVVFIVTYLALLPSFTAINWCPNVYPTMKWAWIKVTFSGILLCVRHCLNSFVLFQFVLYEIKSLCYGIIPSALQCCVRVCN